MKFGSCRSQLYDAQKTARAKWESLGDVWDDTARRDFEEKLWAPLDQRVADMLRAIDQVAVLFTQVRSECEYKWDS